MIKDFETERPPTISVDTGILYADAVQLGRVAKRYQRLGKEMNKQGDPDGLAEVMGLLFRKIDEAAGALLELRQQINDGYV